MNPSKVALITGGGSGIGRAVALTLSKAGYSVAVAGRRSADLEDTAAMAGPQRIVPIASDVSQPDSVAHLFERVHAEFGRLDVLFNNAGINVPAIPMEDLSLEQWMSVVNVNLTGAFLCAQAAVRRMKAQDPRGGRIINNGSISAHTPRPHSAPYTCTKHAITGLTKCISLDGRRHNIACSQVDIGNAVTEMSARMATGVLQANGETAVEARMDVQHVADAVLYIANLPLNTNVQFMTVMATQMPFIGRG